MTVRFGQPDAQPAQREAWTPHTPTASAALPTIAPGNPFLFAHYSNRWTVDAEAGEILPDLVQLSLQPGVGGVGKEVRGGGGDPSGSILSATRRGATVIVDDLEHRVSSALGGPLIARVPVRGGHVWLDYATDAIPGTPHVSTDSARRLDMLRAVRDVLQPPAPHVLEAMIETRERDHAAASMEADRNPIRARERDRIAAELDILRAALAPEEAPPSNRRPRRKPAAPTPDGDAGQE